jgi:hypothetical protein
VIITGVGVGVGVKDGVTVGTGVGVAVPTTVGVGLGVGAESAKTAYTPGLVASLVNVLATTLPDVSISRKLLGAETTGAVQLILPTVPVGAVVGDNVGAGVALAPATGVGLAPTTGVAVGTALAPLPARIGATGVVLVFEQPTPTATANRPPRTNADW